MGNELKLYKIHKQEIEKLSLSDQIIWSDNEITFLPENIVGTHEQAYFTIDAAKNDSCAEHNTSLLVAANLPERFLLYVREVKSEFE